MKVTLKNTTDKAAAVQLIKAHLAVILSQGLVNRPNPINTAFAAHEIGTDLDEQGRDTTDTTDRH